MTGLYKVFPPRWRHVKIPTTSRRAALTGLMLYSACRWQGIWLQRTAWWAVRLFGPHILPGRAIRFEPPDPGIWTELRNRWTEQLGPFDDVAIVERRQANRTGLTLLLMRKGEALAFIRIRRGLDPETDCEACSLRMLRESRPRTFRAPEILAIGQVKSWGYLALSPMTRLPHRPLKRPPLAAIIDEIQRGLETLPRPADIPAGWVPMHGDLTPWNLRRLHDGTLALFDWERAGWGPPGADQLLYQASEVALGWRSGVSDCGSEAAGYWRSRLSGRIEDASLNRALADALAEIVA